MTKRLFISTAIALAILIGYNAVIAYTARTTQRQQLLKVIDHLPAQTDCIFLGNSLMAAGCDIDTFKSVATNSSDPTTAVNLSLGATTPVEHYLILKQALQRPIHLKYLIYGFFDDQLNAPARGNWSDLMGNRVFSYYFPKDAAAFYTPGSKIEEWKLWLVGHVPMLAERSSFWGKIELLRRFCEDIGMPKEKVNQFGRAADFEGLEPKDVASFTNRCENIVRGKKGFSPAINDIVQLAQQHGATVIFVEMPMPSKHRDTFYSLAAWKQMRSYLQSLAAQKNVLYVSASDWVQDNGFEDAMHMNEQGAKIFSAQLAADIPRILLANKALASAAGTHPRNE
jgi:hypothetical protein